MQGVLYTIDQLGNALAQANAALEKQGKELEAAQAELATLRGEQAASDMAEPAPPQD